MKYSELINDFVDGKLNSADEDKLFSMLSTDQDMRYELRDSIRLERAFSNDAGSIAPSAAATVGVFGKLGVTPPGTAGMPPASGWKKFTAGMGKYSNAIISSAISSVATAVIILALLNPWGDKGNIQNDLQKSDANHAAVALSDSSDQNNDFPTVKSVTEEEMVVKNEKPVKERIVYRYIEKNQSTKDNNETSTSKMNNDEFSSNNEIRQMPEHQLKYAVADLNNENKLYYKERPVFAGKDEYRNLSAEADPWHELGLTAEVTANQYWSFPKASVGYSSTPLFNNTSIALMYKMDDDLSAGIDLRQEYFYQEYEGFENGTKFRYMQHPNYLSCGLTAKLRFMDFDYINSFAQVYVGGNQAGPIGRLMYGLEINPSHNYSFILGIEGSLMVYHHGDQYFYSPKIGMHYGIAFDF